MTNILITLMRQEQVITHFLGSMVYQTHLYARGAFPLDQALSVLSPAAALVVSASAATLQTAYITFTVQEPLLLSPFLFGHPSSNNQGCYGIQNMSFNLNLGNANRVWRHYGLATGAASTITNVEIDSVDNCFLQFTYLSVHPSQQLTSRCVVPYYEMSRYISNGGKDIPAFAAAKYLININFT